MKGLETLTIASCQLKIQSKLKLLTQAETKVATYVLNHFEEILSYNVTELAEKAGSSEASVIRFCKTVGYRGYQDFKIDVARDTLPPTKHLSPVLDQQDNISTICRKIFISEIAVLNETMVLLDPSMVEQAVKTILMAERIEIFGSGGSIMVGMDTQHKFLKIGIKTTVHQDMDIQAMSACLLQKGDVAIGISHSGSNRNLLHCLHLAKDRGAAIIAITTQGKSPLNKLADIILYTSTKELVFKSESVSARIAQLAVIDVLVASVAFAQYDKSYEAIQNTRKATSQNKF
jgi:DNA-binding MurR/RpiR family transcriptional regulator